MSRRRVLPFSVKRLTDWDAAAAACSEGVPQSSCKQVTLYHPRGACGVSKRRPELCSPNGTAGPFFATFLGKQKSRYTVAFVQGKSSRPISDQNSPKKIFFQKTRFCCVLVQLLCLFSCIGRRLFAKQRFTISAHPSEQPLSRSDGSTAPLTQGSLRKLLRNSQICTDL